MSAFYDSCMELPEYGSLRNDVNRLTVHRFENCFWVLWHEPARDGKDLGRIVTEAELKAWCTPNNTQAVIGQVINAKTLYARKEWMEG